METAHSLRPVRDLSDQELLAEWQKVAQKSAFAWDTARSDELAGELLRRNLDF